MSVSVSVTCSSEADGACGRKEGRGREDHLWHSHFVCWHGCT